MCVNAAGRLVNHFASDRRNSVSLGNLVERTFVKKWKIICTCEIGFLCNLENETLDGE